MLIYLPYLLLAMPINTILDSAREYDISPFSDAKDKMDNAPSLQLLFNKNDMGWIMTMIFYSEKAKAKAPMFFSALAGAAFGSVHCAAWNFDFPSPVEQLLWRTASLTIVGVCLSIIVGMPFYNLALSRKWRFVQISLETIPAIIYPPARLTLLALALSSLRDLRESALETVSWTKFIPHI